MDQGSPALLHDTVGRGIARVAPPGSFVAEVGVGIVHHTRPRPERAADSVQTELHARMGVDFIMN